MEPNLKTLPQGADLPGLLLVTPPLDTTRGTGKETEALADDAYWKTR
jgi:hypothetical protein